MPVTIKSTGGGSVTMTAASTANDYTLTLPAATGTAVVADGSGNASVSGTFTATGSATAAAFIPSGSSVPTNGEYLPAANTLGWATNSTQQAKLDSAGVFYMNSGFGSVAAVYGCRAWVNFNGTGTVAIRASGNVTSITDNGTGDYTVNFTNALVDANYSFVGNIRGGTGEGSYNLICGYTNGTNTTGAFRISTWNSSAAGSMSDRDFSSIYCAFFR